MDTSDAAHLSGLKPVLELLRDAPGRIELQSSAGPASIELMRSLMESLENG